MHLQKEWRIQYAEEIFGIGLRTCNAGRHSSGPAGGKVDLCAGIVASAETYGDFEYKVLDDGTVEISKYNGTGGEVSIPSEIDGKKVTSIGYIAFDSCESLKSVTIPKSVESIEERAFGYYFDEDSKGNKYDGFKIYCYRNTAGHQYAIDNGFDYELLDAVIPLDVNGDGDVNMRDLTTLQRRINGWNV